MSVSIVQNPPDLSPIENGIRWILSISDIGTDPEIKRAGWIVESSSGVVAEISSTRPGSAGALIYVDIKRNIRGLVFTNLPAIGALGVQNDTNFIKEFRIKYGDIVINTETGAVSNNVTSNSGNYKVFNGANNIWDTAMISSPGVYILTYRPTTYNILRESLDYLWVLGSTTVQYIVYYADGTTQTITQSAPFDANIVPVGLPFLESQLTQPKDNVKSFKIQIGSVMFEVGFENICDETSSTTFLEVLFLEPLGGRSVMVFQNVESASVNRTAAEAYIIKDESNIDNLRQSGYVNINSETFGTYSVRRTLSAYNADEIRWAQGFGASNELHCLIKDVAGNRFWARAVLEGSPSYNTSNNEMTATIKLSVPIRSPYVL